MGWRIGSVGACIVVFALLALPGAALADTTVNFDNLAAGVKVTNQYADLGGTGQGVTFGVLPAVGPDGDDNIVTTPPAGQAQSGANVDDIDSCFTCEFPVAATAGTFGVPHKQVSVDAGYLGPATPCNDPSTDSGCAVVTLVGYDAGGNQVATSAPTTLTEGAGIHTPLSISTPTATIIGFTLRARELEDGIKDVAIDDLSFDTPVTPPPPDFVLTPATATLKVTQGTSATDAVTIGRIGGSTGDVNFALSGALPPGVQASFSPNPAGDGTTTLTLTADPGAPATSGATNTVTVTGTPSGAAVGSVARSFNLTVGVAPAFTISVGDTTNVSLSGCTASVPLFFTRSIVFNGQLHLSVAGLPAGVQATFSPSSQLTFPTGEGQTTAELNLIAPANGQTLPTQTVTVSASDPPLHDQSATFTVGGACPLQYDPQVTSIQITQGVQSPFLPAQNYTTHPASVVSYSTIPNAAELRSGGPTVVRVYADLAFGPSGGVANVPMVLGGYTHNEIGSVVPLPGTPLLPTASPSTLQIGPATATASEEGSETQVYTFTLPPSWTHGQITLGGELEPTQTPTSGQGTALAPCDTTACNMNDALTLANIPFYDTPTITLSPIDIQINGVSPPDPSVVFQWARLITPLPLNVLPYQGTIDASDIARTNSNGSDAANDAVSSRVDDWACDHGAPDLGWDIGVNTDLARGLTNPDDICWSEFNGYMDSVVSWGRPLTSVAHEFFHLLGRPHASDCNGGGSNGQTAESWPPDQMGYTQSVGLDTTLGSGLNGGPYAVPSPPGQTWYDFMSYCASGSNTTSPLTLAHAPSWGSTHNWNAVMESFRFHAADQAAASPRVTSARRPSLEITGFLFHDGTASITTVTPLQAPSRAVTDSGIELVGLDAAGHQVASAPLGLDAIHVDAEVPPVGLSGVIPSAGVATVEIVSSGNVLASRSESPHAPTVSVRGVPVTHGPATTIRWRAHDADGDQLVASIDYSANAGGHYRRIWIGPSHGVVRVSSRYFSRSRHARVRVTVNDGFRSATAQSRVFAAPGASPAVTILSPARGARSPEDAPLLLSGQAFDDAGGALVGKRLRWLLGKQLLGTGTQISATGLRPGRDRIVLAARDRFGRVSRASVLVTVPAARPLFLILSAPKRVKRSARSLRLKVESSLSAQLAVRASAHGKPQRFAVYRRVRKLRVRIHKGSKRLKLRLSLTAGRLTRTVSLSVRR
jgi:hypothetical protein